MDRKPHKFKVGDRVRRTGETDSYHNVIVGNVYIVESLVVCINKPFIRLKDRSGSYDQDNFELISKSDTSDCPIKIGDKVRRIGGDSLNIKQGHVYTVTSIVYENDIYWLGLQDYDYIYDIRKFELYSKRCYVCSDLVEDINTDMGYRLISKIVTPEGNEEHICLKCFKEIVG